MPRQKKQVLKRRKDGRYACRFKDQWFYSSISSDDALNQREQYIRSLKYGDAYNKTVTVFEYGSKWLKLAFPAVSDSTYRGLSIHLQHLVNHIGNVPICEVRPIQIKEVYSTEYKTASNSYIKAAKQLFCSLFDSAVADGICISNPARATKPHKGTEGGHRAITDQEREWINTYCHDHRAYPAIITMLYAGIRPQEAKALTIEKAFDKDINVLHITETAHRKGYNQYEITNQGKTKNAIRDVPVFPPVEEALKGKKGLLITTAKGKQITATTWRVAWNSYLFSMETAINGTQKRWFGRTREHRAMIETGKQLPAWIDFDIVPYTLRHAFCAFCRDSGVEINTCRRWMGHADAQMILKVYDNVSEDRAENERQKVESMLIRRQNGCQPEFVQRTTIEA